VLRRRLILVLALAMAMGLITSYAVYQAVRAARGSQGDVEEIVVAGANIDLGEALTLKHVKMAPWPKSALPPGYLRSVKEAEGRVARVSMATGDPILEARVAPAGQGGLMPVLVPFGKRAVTIKVDEALQKSGFVLPNSRVDVLATMARKQGESKESRTVLQDVTVLAADQAVEMKDNKPVTMTTVTLALSPSEAERLALALNEGKLMLTIRNLRDGGVVSTPGVTTAQLLGSAAPPPAQEKAPAAPARPRTSRARPGTSRAPAPVAMAAPPAPSPPAPQIHMVSVVRGVTATEYTFVRDADRGWVEPPRKADGAKKGQ